MYRLAQLATRYKLVLTLAIAPTFGMLVAAPAGAVDDVDDPFGFDGVGLEFDETFGDEDIATTIASIIKVALTLMGIVVVTLFIYAGFLWMTAAGNDDKIAQAKKIMVAVVVGAAIIFSAWAITKFVIGGLSDATGAGVDIE